MRGKLFSTWEVNTLQAEFKFISVLAQILNFLREEGSDIMSENDKGEFNIATFHFKIK